METNKKFGGAFWDTLNLLIQNNDGDFIINFVDRLPCEQCRRRFFRAVKHKKYNFDKDKNELRRLLWTIRCYLDPKYQNKDTDEDFNSYMKFLLIQAQE